jgi:hypothetical protein
LKKGQPPLIEMVFWFWGLYGLLSGKMRIFGGLHFEHATARIVGLFFMIPLPVSFFLPSMMVRLSIPPADRRFFFLFFEMVILVVCVGSGLLVGRLLRSRQPVEQSNDLET